MKIKRYKKNNKRWSTQLVLMFKKIYQFDKKLIWILFVDIAISSAAPFPYIIFSSWIIDELVKGKDYKQVLLYAGLMFFIKYLINSIGTLVNRNRIQLAMEMTNMLGDEVREKCMEMDYEMFNDTSMHDRATFAMQLATNNSFIRLLDGIKSLFSNVIKLIGVIVIVIQLDKTLFFISLFFIAIQCTIYLINTKNNIRFDVEGIPFNRALNYVTPLCMKTRTKKDIAIYNMSNYIMEKINLFRQSWMEVFNKRMKSNAISDWLTTTLSLGFQMIAYILIGLKVFEGVISIGRFTMGINSLNIFMEATTGIVQSLIDINTRIYNVGRYNSFLNIRSEFRKDATRSLDGIDLQNIEIEFDHVSFKYPASTKYVLKDVNLKINACEKVAIVGENGAGKTTFIMLLTRMYNPTEGRILVNGIDIREIDYDLYMELFSTVYQDFQILAFSILENIAFKKNVNEEEHKRILELFEQNGMGNRLNVMYQGLSTPITKELDNRGEDLSGGEMQKIAIIRALFKNAPVIILDEPTSALDPLAEFEIYQRFSEMTLQKTTVYISHRIASTRFCDRIIVFEKGVVAEIGTFNELIEKRGLYYDMYQKQAQYFKD